MLDTRAPVVIYVLLDLTLAFAVCGLIDRHLYFFVVIGHHYGTERGVVGVDEGIVDGPETVEVKHSFVPIGDRFHLEFGLVADDVVD